MHSKSIWKSRTSRKCTNRVARAIGETIQPLEKRLFMSVTLLSDFSFNNASTTGTGTANEVSLLQVNHAQTGTNPTLTTNFPVASFLSFTGSPTNAQAGDAAGAALAVTDGSATTPPANAGDYIQEQLATTGYQGLDLSFAIQRTGSGFDTDQVSYSTDGTNFTNVGSTFTPAISSTSPSFTAGNAAFLENFDLSSVSAINNQSAVYIRLSFSGPSTGATASGNNRLDNFVLTSSAVVSTGSQPVTVDAPSYSVPENAGSVTVQLDRGPANSTDLNGTETVNYSTLDGSAVSTGVNPNYTAVSSGTATFVPGATMTTISIPVMDVAGQGGNKSFSISLSNPVVTGGTAGVAGSLGTPSSSTVTIVDTTETFSLSSPTYNVNDVVAAGGNTAVLSVVRTGYTGDAATVPFTVTGTVNSSGNVSFAAGQSVAALTFSVPDVTGNQTTSVSISSPTAQTGDFPAVGATASSTVTIVDASLASSTLVGTASKVTNIETTGVYTGATTTAIVNGDVTAGSGNQFAFYAYEILDFNKTTSPSVYPTGTNTVTSLSELTVSLFNENNSGTYAGHPGNISIYLEPDTTTTPSSATPLNVAFDPTQPGGLNQSQFSSPAISLGTFGFVGTSVNYEDYTAPTLSASATSILTTDLNNGSPFRLIVTPQQLGVGAVAAEYEQTVNPPKVRFSGTLTAQAQTYYLDSTTATVTKGTSTAVTIQVDRMTPAPGTFASTDTATVYYTAANGTGTVGSDYNVGTGSAMFSAGASVAYIQVPILNDAAYGDKTFTVTITGVTTSAGAVGSIGTPVTSTVTILDPRTTDVTLGDLNVATVRSTGPIASTTYFNVEADTAAGGSTYASFAVADLTPGSTPASGQTVGGINQITIGLTNTATSSTYKAGLINVYLVDNTAVSISPGTPPPIAFDNAAGDTEGVDSQLGNKYLLGQFTYSPTASTTGYTYFGLTTPLNATATALLASALETSGSDVRIVLTPEDNVVDASFVGFGGVTGFTIAEAPELLVNYTQSTAGSLPSYLAATSSATYSGNLLTVTGPTVFLADPGSAAPDVVASGSAATISFNTTAGSQIHLKSLNLSGGAVATENNPSTNLVVLEIANGLTIDATSTLDIGTGDVDVANGSLSALNALVTRGYNLTGGANWKGTGITSSTAAGNTTHLTAVGVIANNTGGAAPIYTTFDGDNAAQSTDVLLKYTYFGDANLSGTVDGSDYSLIDAGYSADKAAPHTASSGWYNGDFNYDGTVDGSDYALIDNTFNNQKGAIKFTPSAVVAAEVASVPVASVAPTKIGPAIPAGLAARTAILPVARFVPNLFSTTPISSVTASGTLKKSKKGLADSVVDLIGEQTV